MRFSRQDYDGGLPFPSPGDPPDPGIEPTSPTLAGGFFTPEPAGKSTVKGEMVTSMAEEEKIGEQAGKDGQWAGIDSYHICPVYHYYNEIYYDVNIMTYL